MKLREPIAFSRPLKDVRVLRQAAPGDWSEVLREREEAAYQRGRRDGERSLGEQLLRQRNEMMELQQGVLSSLRRALPQVVQDSEAALAELALAVARKVVAELPINAALVEGIVREALRQVETGAEVRVQLHADDLALLQQVDSSLLHGTPEAGSIRFNVSPEVTRGGCLVHTRFGVIDALRETKFEQVRDSLAS